MLISLLIILILVNVISAMPPNENLNNKIKNGQITIPDHNKKIDAKYNVPELDIKGLVKSQSANKAGPVPFKILQRL